MQPTPTCAIGKPSPHLVAATRGTSQSSMMLLAIFEWLCFGCLSFTFFLSLGIVLWCKLGHLGLSYTCAIYVGVWQAKYRNHQIF